MCLSVPCYNFCCANEGTIAIWWPYVHMFATLAFTLPAFLHLPSVKCILTLWCIRRVGQNHIYIYIYIYGVYTVSLGRGITKYTVLYGVYIHIRCIYTVLYGVYICIYIYTILANPKYTSYDLGYLKPLHAASLQVVLQTWPLKPLPRCLPKICYADMAITALPTLPP
jgi:hypothetical protein